eukprot:7549710-Pyramimonas_sp.AAC.2
MSLLDPAQRAALPLAEQLRLITATSGRPFRQPGFQVKVVRTPRDPPGRNALQAGEACPVTPLGRPLAAPAAAETEAVVEEVDEVEADGAEVGEVWVRVKHQPCHSFMDQTRDTPTGVAVSPDPPTSNTDCHVNSTITVRGPTVADRYWGRPQETHQSFAAGGWFRTGDLAIRDPN